MLNFQLVKIYGTLVYSCRSTCLETAQSHTCLLQTVGKSACRQYRIGAACVGGGTYVYLTVEVSSAGDYNRPAAVFNTEMCTHTADSLAVIFKQHIGYLSLFQVQTLGVLDSLFHKVVICHTVYLRTQTVYRRTFAAVQHPALYEGLIRRPAHLAAECVYLAYKMTFRSAAYRRVTRHVRHRIKGYGEQCCFKTKPCPCQRSLTARMTCAYNDYIKIFHTVCS